MHSAKFVPPRLNSRPLLLNRTLLMEAFKSWYIAQSISYSNYVIFPPFGLAACIIAASPLLSFGIYAEQRIKPWEYSKFASKIFNSESTTSKYQISGTNLLNIAYGAGLFTTASIFGYFHISMRVCNRFHACENTKNTKGLAYKHFMTPSLMLILHFLKRLYEVNRVQICTNNSSLSVALLIAGTYSTNSAFILYYQLLKGSANNYINCTKSLIIGSVLYVIGEIGNYYHHYLLRINRLSNNKNQQEKQKQYVIPYGGVFRYVWCPHYLFEILSFIGMSVTSKHLNAYSITLLTSSYLCGRAMSTKEWYHQKFGQQCPERKAIVPFLF
eukprot:415627_1